MTITNINYFFIVLANTFDRVTHALQNRTLTFPSLQASSVHLYSWLIQLQPSALELHGPGCDIKAPGPHLNIQKDVFS